ncbi:MAG: TonB-dependent receptor [Bacteroidales bacterium]|nr:TonB-dependent receptor [Bacteroidales bacterium]MCF8403398.1 TonB-dependent receptor [Bacteroidales bacterium]
MKKTLRNFLALAFLVLFAQFAIAQSGVKGTVKDSQTNETLIGANVVVKGTTNGAPSDLNGKFKIDLDAGSYTMEITFTGYETVEVQATVQEGSYTDLGTIRMESSAMSLSGVSIIADYARERQTPVAFSNLKKQEIENKLGSRDLPMVVNLTPSVYATPQGGGAGDARINIRGFNQRNVAIMLNGVPVNDMENGWVYWSNWDGVADATSSIQMQRGLSAVNLATPSIGGTMNIITSPADNKGGGSARFEYGSGNFMKTTLTGHTGLINEKFAASVSVVRKVGEGVIDKTWTDAWAYYLGASYNINKDHRLEVFAIGAPQRHGQNIYKQNVAAYSHDYAKEIGADTSTLSKFFESPNGRLYNENWNSVNESYTGQQSFNGKTIDRYKPDFLAERENYYHKPITNLNWYAQWSDKVSQFTTLYYSGGTGGGTGMYNNYPGEIYDYSSEPTRIVDWDATIAMNQSDTDRKGNPKTPGESLGILRNSTNNQWTIGAISKVKVAFNDNFKTQFGLDWRTAEIEHYREVRDLLGGNYFTYTGNQFDTPAMYQKGLGDKIAYNNTNTVDWFGGFAQGEWSNELVSVYGTFGYSMIKYSYVNHFVTADTTAAGAPDVNSGELTAETDWISGWQFKGGANYNVNETFNIFGNFGFISKVPIFDEVIDDGDGTVSENPENESFNSYELGAIYKSLDDKVSLKGNLYYTLWTNRIMTRSVQLDETGTMGIAFIKGMKQSHTGIEVEASYRPVNIFGVGVVGSVGNWKYLADVNAIVKNYEGGAGIVSDTVNVYANGLKVGDAPQTQVGVFATVYPVEGMSIDLLWRFYADHYAEFDPTNRDDETDKDQVWKTPSYSVFDLSFNYKLPLKGKVGVDIFAHVFNLFDTFYIQDALDNSPYNGNYNNGGDIDFNHDVNTAEVFLGLPRTFNLGARINL